AVHGLLTSKVVEEHPLPHARSLRDLASGRSAVSALGEHGLGSLENTLARIARVGLEGSNGGGGAQVRTGRYRGLYARSARAVKAKTSTRRGGCAPRPRANRWRNRRGREYGPSCRRSRRACRG